MKKRVLQIDNYYYPQCRRWPFGKWKFCLPGILPGWYCNQDHFKTLEDAQLFLSKYLIVHPCKPTE